MNLKIFTVGLLSAFFSISCLYAAGSSGAQSKTDMKAEFKTRVTKNDFGDIFISKLPELPDKSKTKDLNVIGTTMLVFISYVDNELDFDKLNDSMAKSSGAIDKKGNRKSSVPIDGLISGANKYLSSKNMGLQKVGYTANNFRQRLEDGVPILCWLAVSDLYEGDFTNRLAERKAAKSPDDWSKALRKLEKKRINARGTMYSQALVMGFNKETDEYLIAGLSEKPIWITERELKNLLLNGYILRY